MKKILFLTFIMTILISLSFAGTARTWVMGVASPAVNLINDGYVTNTDATSTAPNYLVTADILETPNEVASTANLSGSQIKLYKFGNGTTVPYAPAVYLNLGNFTTQWVSGQTVRWTVTYTGAGIHNGETATWDTTIPAGTTTINQITVMHNIPPFIVGPTHDYPMLPINPIPAMNATGVDATAAVLTWTVNTDPDYTDPVGFRVFCGTDTITWNIVNGAFVAGGPGTHTYNLPALAPNTHYFWKVIPTTVGVTKGVKFQEVRATIVSRNAVKNAPKADTPNVPIWEFTTAPGTPTTAIVLVDSNVIGMDILRNGVGTNFETPHAFEEVVGSTVTYSVEPNPLLATPAPQTITVPDTPVVFFQYEQKPNSLGERIINLASSDPIVAHFGTGIGQYHVTVDPPNTIASGQIVINIMDAPNPSKFNYAGYPDVTVVVQIWANNPEILNGTDVQVQFQTDVPFQVVVHWALEVEEQPNTDLWPTWYPGTAPSPGYVFSGPVGPGQVPLGVAPFTNSSFVNGTPLNTLIVGPLPPLAPGLRALLELLLIDGPELPVELSSFTAVATAQLFVNLQWTTESETNNLGYNVLRSTQNNPATAQKVNASLIAGNNSSVHSTYNFVDEDVVANTTYYYWLEMVSMSGVSELSSGVTVRVENNTTPPVLPTATTMSKAYPNPFSATHRTQLNVNVKANETANVTVYNILGQAVKSWTVQPGTTVLQWDGKDSKGTTLGCGVYFAKMTSPSKTMTTKMVIVK